MKSIDLTKEKVITLGDLAAAAQADTTELLLSETAGVTPSALEFTEQRRIAVRRGAKAPARSRRWLPPARSRSCSLRRKPKR